MVKMLTTKTFYCSISSVERLDPLHHCGSRLWNLAINEPTTKHSSKPNFKKIARFASRTCIRSITIDKTYMPLVYSRCIRPNFVSKHGPEPSVIFLVSLKIFFFFVGAFSGTVVAVGCSCCCFQLPSSLLSLSLHGLMSRGMQLKAHCWKCIGVKTAGGGREQGEDGKFSAAAAAATISYCFIVKTDHFKERLTRKWVAHQIIRLGSFVSHKVSHILTTSKQMRKTFAYRNLGTWRWNFNLLMDVVCLDDFVSSFDTPHCWVGGRSHTFLR